MKTIAPKILVAPNQRSLAQLRAAFLSLAPSSAKGYYASVARGWTKLYKVNRETQTQKNNKYSEKHNYEVW